MHKDSSIPWEVFVQYKSGGDHVHAGQVHAMSAELALMNARDLFTRRADTSNIWVVPSDQIISSNASDADIFFDPSDDKIYRMATYNTMPEGAEQI